MRMSSVRKFTPYRKLSRVKQQEIDRARRGTWGATNPVTRSPTRPNVYDRNKENRRWRKSTV